MLQPYNSPVLKNYPDDAKEDAGKGLYYWALARESYIGFTYNKNLVSKAAVPKNFDGLLHPELKGKMGISISSTTGSKIIGAMVKSKGEEFVKKLREQQIKLYSIDAPALVNVIASGRDRRLAGNLREPHGAGGFEGRAAGVGANGLGAEQCRAARLSP